MSHYYTLGLTTRSEHDLKRYELFEKTLFQNVKVRKGSKTQRKIQEESINSRFNNTLITQKPANAYSNDRKLSTSFWNRIKSLIFKKHIFEFDIPQKVAHERALLKNLWSIGLLGLPDSGRHAIMFSTQSIFSMKNMNSDQKRNAFVGSNEDDFFSYDMKDYVRFVHSTLLISMYHLCEACKYQFHYIFHSENDKHIEKINNEYEKLISRLDSGSSFPPLNYRLEMSELISLSILWDTELAIRTAFKRLHEIIPNRKAKICPNLSYFILNIQKIAHPDYTPSPSEIFLLPLGNNPYGRRFHSIVPQELFIRYGRDLHFINQSYTSFHLIQHSYFHGIDVPFQVVLPRGKRGLLKFCHLFNMIVYTVDLTSYSQVLPNGRTKLTSVLDNLRLVLENAKEGTPIYLFFTHLDLFMDIARVVDYSIHDPNRPSDLAHLFPATTSWVMNSPTREKQLIEYNYKTKHYYASKIETEKLTRLPLQSVINDISCTFIKDEKILHHIFSYLDAKSLIQVGSTSYLNYVVSSQDSLWMPLCLKYNPSLTKYIVRKNYIKYFRHASKKRVPSANQYWKKMYTTNNYSKFKYLEQIQALVTNVIIQDRKCILRGSFCLNIGNDKLLRRAMSAVMIDFMQHQLGAK